MTANIGGTSEKLANLYLLEKEIIIQSKPLRPRADFRCRTMEISDHDIRATSKNGFVKWENKCVNEDVKISMSSVKFWSGVKSRVSRLVTRK